MELYLKVCCVHLQLFNSQSLIGFKSLIVHFPHWFCKHSCEFASSRHAAVAERVSVAAIWQLDILLQHLSKSNVVNLSWCVAQCLDIDSRGATVVRECTLYWPFGKTSFEEARYQGRNCDTTKLCRIGSWLFRANRSMVNQVATLTDYKWQVQKRSDVGKKNLWT